MYYIRLYDLGEDGIRNMNIWRMHNETLVQHENKGHWEHNTLIIANILQKTHIQRSFVVISEYINKLTNTNTLFFVLKTLHYYGIRKVIQKLTYYVFT